MSVSKSQKGTSFTHSFRLCLRNSLGTKESCCLCCNSSSLQMTFLMCASDLCLSVCVVVVTAFHGRGLFVFLDNSMNVLILYWAVYILCYENSKIQL